MLSNFKQYNESTDKLPVNPRKSHPIATPIAYRDLRYFRFNLHSICIQLTKFFTLNSEFVLSFLHKNHQISSEQASEQMVFLDV